MPAILTHDLFGRGVLEDATALLNLRTPAERDAFLLGNQGPDPLFYLVIDPLMHKWSPLGGALHQASGATVLLATHDAAFVRAVADTASLVFDGEVTATEPAGEFLAGSWLYSNSRNGSWSESSSSSSSSRSSTCSCSSSSSPQA